MRRPLRGSPAALTALLAAVALSAGSAACRRSAEDRAIERVMVPRTAALAKLETEGIAAERVSAAAEGALRSAAGLPRASRAARPGERRYFATATVMFAHQVRGVPGAREPAESRLEVGVVLELARGDGEGALREVARGAERVPPSPEGSGEAWRRALDSALAEAAAAIGQQLAAEEKPDAALLRDLSSSDARTRDLAVRALADRKSAEAVPALLERLDDADDTVVERAVGALAQIGDPRAVAPLIELTHRRDGAFVARMTRIVGEIGGPEAEAYLATLAAGHPEERVRFAAAESLAVVRERARRGVGGAGATAGRMAGGGETGGTAAR